MRWYETKRRGPGLSAIYVITFWTCVRGLVKCFFKVLYRARFMGTEHVPARGPVIFVANHQSHYDPPLIGALVGDRPLTFVARSTLFKFKPFAWLIRLLGAIPIRQGESDTTAIRLTLGELEAGRCVLIFPEGSRTRDGAVGSFRGGSWLLIKKSGATVCPVAIEGLYDVWPIGQSRPRGTGRIALAADKPIDGAALIEMGKEKAMNHLRSRVDALRLTLRKQLREESGGQWPAPSAGDAPTSS